jgi:hypothetical protein
MTLSGVPPLAHRRKPPEISLAANARQVGNMFFRKKVPPSPLSDLCAKCSQQFIAHFVQSGDPEDEFKRAKLLSYLVMYGANQFINDGLNVEKNEIWFRSSSIITDNNRDVLIAETINWICYLIGRLWISDKEPEIRERVGYLTLTHTNRLCVSTISEATKVDFHDRAIEGRGLYIASEKGRGDICEVFAGRLAACLENNSLVDKPKIITPEDALMMPIDFTVRLYTTVSLFFGAMPLAIYRAFKNALHEYPDKFPWD